MRHLSRVAVVGMALLTVLTTAASVRAQFSNLVRRVPANANAMILIDVEKLMSSPLAKTEGWRARLEQAHSAGLTILPPEANQFMLSSQLDYQTFQPSWEVAVIDVKYEPSIPKAAVRYGGKIDNIEGLEAAVMPDDAYVIKFGPKLVGAMSPAVRQNVARWINQVHASETGALSPYMQQAVGFAETSAGIIMALDLQHVTSADEIHKHLAGAEALQNKGLDFAKLSQVLASIRGVMLGVTVTDKRYGAIRIDFGQDATPVGDLAKPILLSVLARHGLMIDEFQDWESAVNGNTVQLSGVLYESGMRRVLSLLDAPPSVQRRLASPSEDSAETDKEKLTIAASQQYYMAIDSLLRDLKIKRTSSDFVTFGQVGGWFEKYADKIDRLPILNVDPELLDYGAYVAQSLRGSEKAMKGIGAESGYRKTEVPNFYNYHVQGEVIGVTRRGVAGAYSWTASEDLAAKGQAEARIRTQERIKGNATANDIAQNIAEASASIRRRMTEKYQVEF